MDNREEILKKMEIDAKELDKVSGGISDSRKAKIRDYVAFFKRKGYYLESIKHYWAERSENKGLSEAELQEDYKFIESIF